MFLFTVVFLIFFGARNAWMGLQMFSRTKVMNHCKSPCLHVGKCLAGRLFSSLLYMVLRWLQHSEMWIWITHGFQHTCIFGHQEVWIYPSFSAHHGRGKYGEYPSPSWGDHWDTRPGQFANWKITIFKFGKSTINDLKVPFSIAIST